MKNVKLENNLVGKNNWPKVAFIDIQADSVASELPENLSDEDKEKVIQSWDNVAVLEASPSTPFRVGFIVGDLIQLLKVPVETTNNMFGMRIGNQNTRFFALPVNLEVEMDLKLVAITNENDPKYQELPLY